MTRIQTLTHRGIPAQGGQGSQPVQPGLDSRHKAVRTIHRRVHQPWPTLAESLLPPSSRAFRSHGLAPSFPICLRPIDVYNVCAACADERIRRDRRFSTSNLPRLPPPVLESNASAINQLVLTNPLFPPRFLVPPAAAARPQTALSMDHHNRRKLCGRSRLSSSVVVSILDLLVSKIA